MDDNNWRPAHGESNPTMNPRMNPNMNANLKPNVNPDMSADTNPNMNPNMNNGNMKSNMNAANIKPNVNSNMNPIMNPNAEASDWRKLLSPNSRKTIVKRIIDALGKHKSISGSVDEAEKFAARLEEKIHSEATDQNDYIRRISMKMITMGSLSQGTTPGTSSMPSDNTSGNQNSQDGVRNHQQQHQPSVAMGNQSQSRHGMTQQNLQNNIPSATLPPAMPSITGVPQTSMTSVAASQNSVSASLAGTGFASNMFSSQRQFQLRQGLPQQFVQNCQQFNMLQQQMLNKKLQVQSSLSHSQLPQQPRSPLMQTNQMQRPQQSLMHISSGLQTSYTTLQQAQSSIMQSTAQSGLQPNSRSHIQESTAGLQQHQQSVMRQQQISQESPLHQQQTTLGQLQMLPSSQQQHQLLGQQLSGDNMQQSQLMNQQQHNNVQEMQQQQRLLDQQQQELIGQQSSISNLHQQIGSQSNVRNMQQLQQSMRLQATKRPTGQVAASSTLLSSQGHPGQLQTQQQQLISQLQHSPTQMQQRGLQQKQQQQQQQQQQQLQQQQRPQPSVLQLDMQQRTQTSATSGLIGADWQEQVYQKIKSMKDMYYPELSEMYGWTNQKLQQADTLPQGQKSGEQMEQLKHTKAMLERMLRFLSIPKSNVQAGLKEKLLSSEKVIVNFLNSHRLKKLTSVQKLGSPSSVGQSQPPISQLAASQIPQLQHQDGHMNQIQPINLQGSITPNVQHGGSMVTSTHLGVPQPQQNMVNSLQAVSSLDMGQGNLLPPGMMSSGQQTLVNGSQQSNVNTISQGGLNMLQQNMNTLQSNTNVLQHQQHMKPQQDQQQQMMQAQQLKQFQQRQMHPQLLQQHQKQQLILQQQQQQLQQQMPQIRQMNNDVNDLKVRQGEGIFKQGMFPQHHQPGLRSAHHHQQMKLGFPISSSQFIQSQSPQISQQPSPQNDQQNLLTSLPKNGTPSQTAGSPFVPSPSTPLLAPSPIPSDTEKPQTSAVSSVSNAGNIGHQQIASNQPQAQYLAIGTPGISVSPLLAEFSSPDGNQVSAATSIPGMSNLTDQPLERLINVVRSMSSKVFSSSMSDIDSVASIVDRIAGSAPGNGSRAAVGEDLVAMTKCRLQARNIRPPDGSASAATKKLRRLASVMPLNAASSSCSDDSLKQLTGLEASELESTATSRIKRQKVMANSALMDEIQEINLRLIHTIVEISDEDADSFVAAAEGEGGIVKCSYNAVALSPSMQSQLASAPIYPILLLRLLVPFNYPNCSPVILDKVHDESSKEKEDLSVKTKSRFHMCIRGLSQPISVAMLARTWDACARKVILEYAQQSGGGSFSSSYGTWESCVSA